MFYALSRSNKIFDSCEADNGNALGRWKQVDATEVGVVRPRAPECSKPYEWVSEVYSWHVESVVDPARYNPKWSPPAGARSKNDMAQLEEHTWKRAQTLKAKSLYLGIADHAAIAEAAKQPGLKYGSGQWRLPERGRTLPSMAVASLGRASMKMLRHGDEISEPQYSGFFA